MRNTCLIIAAGCGLLCFVLLHFRKHSSAHAHSGERSFV